ncbi:MAG: AAA family ATPase [Bacteroidaceae bacterium]|nr:AAA family ATPase [Bacteroidaceae bacterium]
MSTENYRVKIGVTSKGGVCCECRESFFGKVLGYGSLAVVGVYGLKKLIDVGAKKIDRWLNGNGKDTKGTSIEANKQNSPQATIEVKEEALTDFSKPITEGKQVEFLFDKSIPKNGITLLAAAKGVGKSGVCMQIAQNLARIGKYPLFNADEVKETVTVVYADYELKEEQIKTRYPSLQNNNYFRWSNIRNTKSAHLLSSLRKTLNNIPTTSALVVIDNLSKIDGLGNADKAKQFYEELEVIRDEYSSKGVSVAFILVAHLEREKNIYKEITPCDLTGAASIYYYADAVLAIGTAREEGTIYLKELEIRDRAKEENVYVFKRNISDWLHYEFVGMTTEREALPVKSGDKNAIQVLNEEVEIEDEIIKQARNLSDKDVESIKDGLPAECFYDNMSEDKKEEALNILRKLAEVADSARHTHRIFLLKYGLYTSRPTVTRIWNEVKSR